MHLRADRIAVHYICLDKRCYTLYACQRHLIAEGLPARSSKPDGLARRHLVKPRMGLRDMINANV